MTGKMTSSAGAIILAIGAMSLALGCLATVSPASLEASSAGDDGAGGLLYIPSNASLAHCPSSCGDVVDISYPFRLRLERWGSMGIGLDWGIRSTRGTQSNAIPLRPKFLFGKTCISVTGYQNLIETRRTTGARKIPSRGREDTRVALRLSRLSAATHLHCASSAAAHLHCLVRLLLHHQGHQIHHPRSDSPVAPAASLCSLLSSDHRTESWSPLPNLRRQGERIRFRSDVLEFHQLRFFWLLLPAKCKVMSSYYLK